MSRYLIALLLAAVPTALGAQATGRTVSFTFDDLPVVRSSSLADAQAITSRLLARIRDLHIPAIGFVNEGKLHTAAGEDPARTALLEAWLAQGLELGNHTYSHMRLYDARTADFEADVLRGERVTRRLMEARGLRLKYFRHPTLSTGRDLQTKAAIERFLAEHGYTIAPVTIDNDEYLYALAYDRARTRGDSVQMRRVGEDYVRYMTEIFEHFERLSQRLLGREPAQVLLLHANSINADWLDELAGMISARGYRFVTLEAALADPAYAQPDQYIGARGPSWLERWASTRGIEPGLPPSLPAWVQAATR